MKNIIKIQVPRCVQSLHGTYWNSCESCKLTNKMRGICRFGKAIYLHNVMLRKLGVFVIYLIADKLLYSKN